MSQPLYPQVTVQLSGRDGNAFSIIASVTRALRREVGDDAADSFTTAAFESASYDDLLRLAMSTVAVQ